MNNSTIAAPISLAPIEIVEITVLVQITFFTLVGNTLVVLAFAFGPRNIRNYTNYFVVNLAVADVLIGCICLPFWIIYRTDNSLINRKVFQIFIQFDLFFGVTSIFNLAVISVERVLAVWYPSVHINLSKRLVVSTIFATWFVGVILTSLMSGVDDYYVSTGTVVTVGFFIPLLIIIVSYCAIFYAAVNMMRATNEFVSVARELRIAKTISLVIGLFVICWCPFFLLNLIHVFCNTCVVSLWIIYVSKSLHYSNSMMNFFIYAARSPDFQSFFKKFLCPANWRIGRKTTASSRHEMGTLKSENGTNLHGNCTKSSHFECLKDSNLTQNDDPERIQFKKSESFESYLSSEQDSMMY